MSFQTGTTTSVQDLLQKLRDFASSDGWTINENSLVSSPYWLAMEKGNCFVNFYHDTSSTTTSYNTYYSTNSAPMNFSGNDAHGTARTDANIRVMIAQGHTASGSGGTFTNQPGSAVDSTSNSEPFIRWNSVGGSSVYYAFFSGDTGDAPYIYVVVEQISGEFTHCFFGEVDKRGLTYDPPAAFATGTFYSWIDNSTTQSSYSCQYASFHYLPFEADGVDRHTHVNPGGGIPDESVYPYNGRAMVLWARDNDDAFLPNPPSEFFPSDFTNGADAGYWMSTMFYRGPVGINNVTPLIPIPVCVSDEGATTFPDWYYFLGEMPNIRMCSLKGRSAKEEVTIGSDTWVLFPVRHLTENPYVTNVAGEINTTSYLTGFAIKKIV